MPPQYLFVFQFEFRRIYHSVDHLRRRVKESKVVRSEPRICQGKCGSIYAPARTPDTLRIICRQRRYISQKHRFKVADIDPHFKCGGT